VGKVSQWTFEQAKVSQISFLSVPTKRLEVLQHEGCRTRQKQKRGARLYLSKIGFFALILHRELPENQVCQMCVKVYASGRSYIIFLVEEAGVEEQSSKEAREGCGC